MISRDIDLTEKLDFNKDKVQLPMISNRQVLSNKKGDKKCNNNYDYRRWITTAEYSYSTTSTTSSNYYNFPYLNNSNTSTISTTYSALNIIRDDTVYNVCTDYNDPVNNTVSIIINGKYDNSLYNAPITSLNDPINIISRSRNLLKSTNYKFSNRNHAIFDHKDRSMKTSKAFDRGERLMDNYVHNMCHIFSSLSEKLIPWEIKHQKKDTKNAFSNSASIPWLNRLSRWDYYDYMKELKEETVNYMQYLTSSWYDPRRFSN